MEDIKQVFKIYDVDFDGFITKNDVINLTKQLDFDIGDKLDKLDDKIDLDTFINIFNVEIGIDKDIIHNAFKSYDVNNTGKILVTDLIQIINEFVHNTFIDGDVDELLKELDIDEDGYIDYNILLELIK